jgi:hypothetical protein
VSWSKFLESAPPAEHAEAVLMWLSRHQPSTAQRVLQGAPSRYARV